MTCNHSPIYNLLWLPCALGELPEPALPLHWSYHSSSLLISSELYWFVLKLFTWENLFLHLPLGLFISLQVSKHPLLRESFPSAPSPHTFLLLSLAYFRMHHNYKLPPPFYFYVFIWFFNESVSFTTETMVWFFSASSTWPDNSRHSINWWRRINKVNVIRLYNHIRLQSRTLCHLRSVGKKPQNLWKSWTACD